MTQLILRNSLAIVFLLGMLFTASGVRAQSAELEGGNRATTSASERLESVSRSGLRNASPLDYEMAAPPAEQTRPYCDQFPSLCEWLALKDASSEREQADQDQAEAPDGNGSGDRESESISTNRSVVGWQSASIDTLEQQNTLQPVAMEVPSLTIAAGVTGVGTDANRAMQVPDDFNTVGWYRYGPSPGEPGSAVVAGHLDDARGRSVFFDLQRIEVGAEVYVTFEDSSRARFRVYEKRSYDSGNIPSKEIFARNGDPVLALITCGGRWDSSIGRYTETVVIYAEPA
jgi:sortase (surface protein transpeptidase)